MKLLKERAEIAKALNFNKYPVIVVDVRKYRSEYGVTGIPVRVEWNYKGEILYKKSTFDIYDDGCVGFHSGGTMLKSDFGPNDIIEMATAANTPIIKPNQEIIIVVLDNMGLPSLPMIVKTGEKVDVNCLTVLSLDEGDGRELYTYMSLLCKFLIKESK